MPDANFTDTRYVARVIQYEHAWPSLSSLFNDAGLVDNDFEEPVRVYRCRIYNDTAVGVLHSSFTEPVSVLSLLSYDPSILIDNGDTITRNEGLIFTENQLTQGLTDIEVARKVGVAFTVIRSARKGKPNWVFKSIIDKFSKAFSFDPNEIRSNFASVTSRLQRSGSSITRFNPNPRAGAQFYFGLGDPPSNLHTPLGEPYGDPKWIHVSGWENAPVASSGLNTLSLACDQRAYWVHLWVRRGRVAVTFNNRTAGLNSFDHMMGVAGAGSESGSDGDFRIDEFDYDNGASLTSEDLETFCFFGFTRPAEGSTPEDNVEYRLIRVHPKAVRLVGIDSTAQIMYSFERVGDSRTGEFKVNRAGEEAVDYFKSLANEPPPMR